MSKRGPKPTPTPILQLRKSWRANDRPSGIQLDQKRPPCPKRFILKGKTADGESVRRVARSTWNALAGPLHKAGLLTRAYREALECLCDSYGRYVFACNKCDELGMTAMGSSGNTVKSPWFAIRNQMFDQIFKAAACFGLTPADISGVRALQKPTTDEGKGKYFKGVS